MAIPISAGNDGRSSGATPIVLAYPNSNVAGNFLWASVMLLPSGASVTGITDTRGNTWSRAKSQAGSGAIVVEIWYAPNCAAGANTVTVATTGTPANGIYVFIHEWSGIQLSSPLDVTASFPATSSPFSSGSAVTTAPNDLIVGAIATNSGSTISAGSGFTLASTFIIGDVNAVDEVQVQSLAGSIAGIFTAGGGSNAPVVMAAFFAQSNSFVPKLSLLGVC